MKRPLEGFLLIELLVAMAIMSCVALVLAQYQAGIIQVQRDACNRMQAIAIAGERLDKILVNKRLPSELSEQVDQFTIRYEAQQVPLVSLDMPYILQEKPSFYTISVWASWGQHSVYLSSGMGIT
ncbi:MAG TPA: type II secretion system protein [Candidatus Dependentiae bacterium]|nr:type II secretion system protein [Candidatus Dependentiae bacterium]HRQ62461.1 type II secretion system protein [Candidatus Dependentiae bacterium]